MPDKKPKTKKVQVQCCICDRISSVIQKIYDIEDEDDDEEDDYSIKLPDGWTLPDLSFRGNRPATLKNHNLRSISSLKPICEFCTFTLMKNFNEFVKYNTDLTEDIKKKQARMNKLKRFAEMYGTKKYIIPMPGLDELDNVVEEDLGVDAAAVSDAEAEAEAEEATNTPFLGYESSQSLSPNVGVSRIKRSKRSKRSHSSHSKRSKHSKHSTRK